MGDFRGDFLGVVLISSFFPPCSQTDFPPPPFSFLLLTLLEKVFFSFPVKVDYFSAAGLAAPSQEFRSHGIGLSSTTLVSRLSFWFLPAARVPSLFSWLPGIMVYRLRNRLFSIGSRSPTSEHFPRCRRIILFSEGKRLPCFSD